LNERQVSRRGGCGQSCGKQIQKWKSLFWRRKQMSDRDKVSLTAWQEWRKYHRFPADVLLHITLVVFISVLIMLQTYEFTDYNRANENTFKHVFYPEDYREGIFSISDAINLINNTVHRYYLFPLGSVDRFEHIRERGDIIPPRLEAKTFTQLGRGYFNFSNPQRGFGNFSTVTQQFDLTLENPLGPFNQTLNANDSDSDESLRHVMYLVDSFDIRFSFANLNIGNLLPIPYIWTITQSYDLSQGGKISFSISTEIRLLRTYELSEIDIFTLITILILFCAGVSLFLSTSNFIQGIQIYQRAKQQYSVLCHLADPNDHFPNWKSIPFRTKSHFFSLWSLWDIIRCVILMVSCFFGVFTEFGASTNEPYNILSGVSCLMSYIHLIKYLGFSKGFFTLALTWAGSFRRTASFLVIVTPLFLGYALVGMLNFAQYSERFVDFDSTTVTLFSLILGDDVRVTFDDISGDNAYPYPVVSRIYLYTFLTFFITSVLNIFIFIIEDAYHASKKGYFSLSGPELLEHQVKGEIDDENNDDDEEKRSKPIHELSYDERINIIFNNLSNWERKLQSLANNINSNSNSSNKNTFSTKKSSTSSDTAIPITTIGPASLEQRVSVLIRQKLEAVVIENQRQYLQELDEKIKETQRKYQNLLNQNIASAIADLKKQFPIA